MELASLLKPEAVRVIGKVTSKKRLLQELAETASACYGLCPKDAVDALQDREGIGPTGVGGGVALPHARLAGLDHIAGVFLRLERPLEFNSVDRQPVDLVFALFAPLEEGVEHLKALAVVSRAMRNASVCAKLRANDTPQTLHALLTDTENTKAA
ncbi:MAG: PTS sugar transporter subunit IIA [Pseudomonadota bacterium]